MSNIGRNDPCPCGSGKKYKKCCINKSQASAISFTRAKIRQVEGEMVHKLINYSENKYSQEAMIAAWQDFVVGRDIDIFDPNVDIDSFEEDEPPLGGMVPEFETIFIPWFLFSWVPDPEPYFEEDDELAPISFPEQTIVSHYLEKKGKYLPAFSLSFLEQAQLQPFSYYLITHVIPGKQVTVNDIFREQEFTIDEIQGSESLTVGAIIFARVITLDETSVFFGMAPYIIPQDYYNDLIDLREELKSTRGEIDLDILALHDFYFRELYFEIRETLVNSPLPELQNTDGEPLLSTDLLYSLNCSLMEAFEALNTLSLIPSAELLQEAKFNSQGELLSLEFPWMEKGNQQHSDWDNTVKGYLTLENQELKVRLDSSNRAEQIKQKISRRLGKLALLESETSEPFDEFMGDFQASDDFEDDIFDVDDFADSPEIQKMLTEVAEEYWKSWLDTPIPELNNQSPRQAAQSKTGKELLEAQLFELHAMSKINPEVAPDLAMLRRELGME